MDKKALNSSLNNIFMKIKTYAPLSYIQEMRNELKDFAKTTM